MREPVCGSSCVGASKRFKTDEMYQIYTCCHPVSLYSTLVCLFFIDLVHTHTHTRTVEDVPVADLSVFPPQVLLQESQ